jgi:CRP-like cAMP-binding protein
MTERLERSPDFIDLIRHELPLLYRQCRPRRVRRGEQISSVNAVQKYCYVVENAILSLGADLADGRGAVVVLLGRGSVIGACQFYGQQSAPYQIKAQKSGTIWEFDRAVLAIHVPRSSVLSQRLAMIKEHLFIQVTQSALCNRLHHIEQQVAKTLLLYQDMTQQADLQVTQQELSELLGVRREGVTQAIGKLQAIGAIATTRGHVHVIQRRSLEQQSCECYHVVAPANRDAFTAGNQTTCSSSQRRFKKTIDAAATAKTNEIPAALIRASV